MIEFYKEIFNYIQKLSGNKDLAQDLTQETYAKALNLKLDKKDIENKRAYLYKTARNLVFDESRKKKNHQEIVYQEESYSISEENLTEEILYAKERKKLLFSAIKNLPSKNRESFYLYAIEGLTRKEIAFKLGVTISAVDKNIKRASIKIQDELEKKVK